METERHAPNSIYYIVRLVYSAYANASNAAHYFYIAYT